MVFSVEQLSLVHQLLSQRLVYIDAHLRQGALVYIESLLVESHIPRTHYLTLDDLSSPYPMLRLTSWMPVDFFSSAPSPSCQDDPLRPIKLTLCTAKQQPNARPIHRWQTLGTFRCADALQAIQCLLIALNNPAYFSTCRACELGCAAGYLNARQLCCNCVEVPVD
ncbi:hypothetical protein [Photobacterium sp. TY1-4]|uniref:hypothetical protein n=1 Tax=Photobacterium sp. TY1-4 TaxID=2899122 RepID=UPI0021C24B1C|nr:hypothetical protein [Photobacterium sp. TY1-4]UXI00033.1 hypothetical protein NH461_09315 [Photobacterium sp. TY1-4]